MAALRRETKMIGQKLLNLAGVPPEKLEDCMQWAFGEYHEEDPIEALRQRWNARHADIFFVSRKDHPKAFIWSIGKAYVLHNLSRRVIIPRGTGGFN
jgi:hypothetical protein